MVARALINQTSSPVSPQTSLRNGSQADAQTNQVDGNACVQLALPLSFHAGSAPPELAVY